MQTYVEFSNPIDDYCEALTYQFGYSTMNFAGGGASQRAQSADFSFTKTRDSLSNALLQSLVAGTVFDTVWVELYRYDDDEYPYYTYTLKNVQVSALTSGAKSETVSLSYTRA